MKRATVGPLPSVTQDINCWVQGQEILHLVVYIPWKVKKRNWISNFMFFFHTCWHSIIKTWYLRLDPDIVGLVVNCLIGHYHLTYSWCCCFYEKQTDGKEVISNLCYISRFINIDSLNPYFAHCLTNLFILFFFFYFRFSF